MRPLLVLSSQTCSFPQMKLWRLPAPGQELPSGPGLVLGPEDTRVEVLQFHPTVDGILVSTAGTAVKVWDVAKQQPLTGTDHISQVAFWAAPSRTVFHFCVYVFDIMSHKVSIENSHVHSIKSSPNYKHPNVSISKSICFHRT